VTSESQVEMTNAEFCMIRDLIHEKFGIYYDENKAYFLCSRLTPRMDILGIVSFTKYLDLVKSYKEEEKELSKMISELSNNETYFFREKAHFEMLAKEILPKTKTDISDRENKTINILSAGCSTGEEAYSLAMLIYESGSFCWDWKVNICGIDIDEKAIGKAQKGIYNSASFRMTDPKYKDRFFTKDLDQIKINENIKRMTSFKKANIIDPSFWADTENMDIIFCRNVLIYFSDEKANKALEFFYENLNLGGTLFLGHSETIYGSAVGLEPVRFPETIIYQKMRN
jgi:chemotaxis protein methyltransferase CheR